MSDAPERLWYSRSVDGEPVCHCNPDGYEEAVEYIRADVVKALAAYVGYAACHGDKCRLPHCHSCNYPEDVEAAYERLDKLLRAAGVRP